MSLYPEELKTLVWEPLMQRFLVLLFAVAVAGILPLPAQKKGATIAFESTTHDFGKVSEGAALKHVFKFANKGNETLEIIRVDASCGCTSVLLSEKTIAPGKSGDIEVVVATKGLPASELSKTVSVMSNDPRQRVAVLTLTAVVELEFVISESSIYFGNVPRGHEVIKEILVTIPPNKPFTLLEASSTDASVTVKLEPVAGSNGKQFKVIALQKADAAEGFHNGAIVIKTTSSAKPELQIPVRGLVLKGK
jgi:hypothetical protein